MTADQRRQLATMAERLSAKVPPGHVDYISKAEAAHWIETLLSYDADALADARSDGEE